MDDQTAEQIEKQAMRETARDLVEAVVVSGLIVFAMIAFLFFAGCSVTLTATAHYPGGGSPTSHAGVEAAKPSPAPSTTPTPDPDVVRIQ